MTNIAVVTPMFNGARFIESTVRSLAGQLRDKDEYIIVDDGSTDEGADIARAVFDKVRIVRQANQGEAAAVNAGVKASSASVIGIVNADDPILPGLIDAVRAAFEAEPELDAVYPDWVRIDETGAEISRHQTRDFSIRALYGEHLCIPGPGAFFRAAALGAEHIRDPEMVGLSDYDFWLRFALTNRRIRRIPRFLASWRAHRSGGTYQLDGLQLARRRIVMIERLFARADLPADIAALRSLALSAAHYNAALQSLRYPGASGFRHAVNSYRIMPFWPAGVGTGQRRSLPRLCYSSLQPFSAWVHDALAPILPSRYRRASLLDQTFGLDPPTAR